VRLEFRHHDETVAAQEARALAAKFGKLLVTDNWKMITMIGPVPCFFWKQDGQYRWQIVLRGPDPKELVRAVGQIAKSPQGGNLTYNWRVEVDPVSLL
jgi:primosomal protein N' (replication factor Y)